VSASHTTPVATDESPTPLRRSSPQKTPIEITDPQKVSRKRSLDHGEVDDGKDGEQENNDYDDEDDRESELNDSTGSHLDTLRARAKLADFGSCALVKQGSAKAMTHYTGGTPPYSAPEVCKAERRRTSMLDGFLADSFSCGVLLYVVASNCVPWDTAEMSDSRYAAFVHTYYPEWLSRKKSTTPRRERPGRDYDRTVPMGIGRGELLGNAFDDEEGGETPVLGFAPRGVLAQQQRDEQTAQRHHTPSSATDYMPERSESAELHASPDLQPDIPPWAHDDDERREGRVLAAADAAEEQESRIHPDGVADDQDLHQHQNLVSRAAVESASAAIVRLEDPTPRSPTRSGCPAGLGFGGDLSPLGPTGMIGDGRPTPLSLGRSQGRTSGLSTPARRSSFDATRDRDFVAAPFQSTHGRAEAVLPESTATTTG